jgi:CubicO group peptidase (beta-lactamase class C family)
MAGTTGTSGTAARSFGLLQALAMCAVRRIARSVLVALLCSVAGTSLAGAVEKKVDQYLRAQMALNHIPGLALVVVKDGKLLKQSVYGQANIETGSPVTAATMFQTASVSKPFAGLLLMKLAEDGKLSLDDPVTRHIPKAPAAWAAITLRQLAAHSSGISDAIPRAGIATTAAFVEAAMQQPLAFTPGSRSSYGIAGYIVLQHVIESITGKSYEDALREHVLGPLGMQDARFDHARSQGDMRRADVVPGRAGIYEWNGRTFENFSFPFTALAYSAGGLLLSPRDAAQFLQHLDGEDFIDRASLTDLWTLSPLDRTGASGFAGGWVVGTDSGQRFVGHSGGPALADLRYFPQQRLGVLVLINAQAMYPYLASAVAGFYLPAVSPSLPEAIADTDPQLSTRLRALLEGTRSERIDEALFTPTAQKEFLPSMRSFLLPYLRALEPIRSFVLTSIAATDEGSKRRYVAQHGRRLVTWEFALASDGKVTAFGAL